MLEGLIMSAHPSGTKETTVCSGRNVSAVNTDLHSLTSAEGSEVQVRQL